MTIEKHYAVKELAALLGWSRTRVARHFKYHPRTVRDGVRYFIPHSAVEEELAKMRNDAPSAVRKAQRRKHQTAPPAGLPDWSGAISSPETPQ
jgi:hypothetical protein